MNKIAVGLVASLAFFTTTVSAQCRAVIQKAGSNLKIVRSGDLTGDGAREYVAVRKLPQQPQKGMYVSRLLIAHARHGQCSIVLDAGKNGPKNPIGYIGIEFIDDGGDFYGYAVEFGSDEHKGDVSLTWLNPQHEPEGMPIGIGWNGKVGRYQEYRLEDDSSPEIFKPEVRNPPHRNSKLCRKCPK